uniref:sodium/hydrogen exchanger 9B1 isoform X3 n=1 Tax=Ictidomys tridecemlineatus TaxID=43179 RepID=UPI001A9CF1B2|nr:sodium/hydrogen exchanger 9B1 isoform X3 [Ictidomys tridecemlineatus]
MHTTNSKNEHLEKRSDQILNDPKSSTYDQAKGTLSETQEMVPQTNKQSHISCPPQGIVNKIITNGVILFMLWCLTWTFSGSEALPDGNLFGLIIIFCSAFLGGKFLEIIKIPSVPPLPPLLGMLLAGFMIRNIPFIGKHVHVHNTWSATLRNTALTIILIRAGLGLDPQGMSKRLISISLTGSTDGKGSETLWIPEVHCKQSFVLGAVSPAVVVPSMLLLQEKGYGIEKGIPTLLIAASSLDDIVAITGFNTFLSIVFSSGGVIDNILSSLRDILVGVLVGTVLGCFFRYFPSADQEKLSLKRAFLILSICISAVLGSQRIGLHGSGGLCTLVSSFLAGTKWSKDKIKVQNIVAQTWNVFQPLLFGLVGSEVAVSSLETNTIGLCVITMSLAVCVRILMTFVLMCFAGFTFKEKIFIALSWLPKATVQAVLGPLALETARLSNFNLIPYSKDVMTVAFLAILITAPNGALFIGILGPKILTRHNDPDKIKLRLPNEAHH